MTLSGFTVKRQQGQRWRNGNHRKEMWSQKSPTYIRQEETAGIGLHQEVFGAHVDGDMDRLVLFGVWAVPLILARHPAIAIVHRAGDLALTRGAGPAPPTGVH